MLCASFWELYQFLCIFEKSFSKAYVLTPDLGQGEKRGLFDVK